jgi:RNA polymerase sigma-70 factor (ECF subfamily)
MANPPQSTDTAAPDRLDPDGFAALFQAAFGQLWLIAAGIVGDRAGAEDIVQEAAIAALEKLEQFHPGTNFNAWLARFVRWHAFNYVRKHTGRNTLPADPHQLDLNSAHEVAELPNLKNDLAGEIPEYQTHFDDEVVRALRAVSDTSRACLLLRTLHQLSYREIAELLDIPEGTAMSHVHRTRRVLRERLKNESTGSPATE